ncbi:MAG: hypothetical protein ACHQF0_01745 [Chitinophagales bacterium]
MRELFLLIFLFFIFKVHAQLPPVIQWQKCLGGSGDEWITDIQPTSDGGYILASSTHSHDSDITFNHGNTSDDAWIIKIDGKGNMQWQKFTIENSYLRTSTNKKIAK